MSYPSCGSCLLDPRVHLRRNFRVGNAEGGQARQESGPPEPAEHRREMRYNDSGHKELPHGQWGW